MNSCDNLDPVRTKDEARKRGRNGGIASGEARRKKKSLREWALFWRDRPSPDPAMTMGAAAAEAMFREAIAGNPSAFRELARILGEEVDRHELVTETKEPLVLSLVPPDQIARAKREKAERDGEPD